jgi:hypothetical protein
MKGTRLGAGCTGCWRGPCVRHEWFETTLQKAIEAVQTATAPREVAKPVLRLLRLNGA